MSCLIIVILTTMIVPDARAAARVSVSPPIDTINADPGSVARGSIAVRLLDAGSMHVSVSAEALQPAGLDSFVVPDSTASSWVIPDTSRLALTTTTDRTLSYRVRVPLDATPGAHAFAVLITRTSSIRGTNTDGNSGVSALGAVGAVIVVTVTGDLRSSMRVREIHAPRWVHSGRPARFAVRISNTGNTLLTPSAKLHTGSFIGIADEQVEVRAVPLLPRGTREVTATWSRPPLLGWFHPRVIVTSDTARAQSIALTPVFVIPPWWLLLLITVGVALPALGVWRARRHTPR